MVSIPIALIILGGMGDKLESRTPDVKACYLRTYVLFSSRQRFLGQNARPFSET